MGTQKKNIHVSLIHGTWAKNASWASIGSDLRSALKHQIYANLTFSEIKWQGYNRNQSRIEARETLVEEVLDNEENIQLIIGHSHGGNVGADAMQEFSKVTNKNMLLVTLNTPFLCPMFRSGQTLLIQGAFLSLAISLAILTLISPHVEISWAIEAGFIFSGPFVLVILFYAIVAPFHKEFFQYYFSFIIMSCSVLAISYPFVESSYMMNLGIIIAVPSVFCLIIAAIVYPFRNELHLELATFFATLENNVSQFTTTVAGPSVLCINTRDDEALGGLQLAETLINLPYLLIHKITLLVSAVCLPLAHYFFNWSFSPFVGRWSYHLVGSVVSTFSGREGSLRESIGTLLGPYRIVDPAIISVWAHELSKLDSFAGIFLYVFITIFSSFEYFILFWVVISALALIGNFVLSAVTFGYGFNIKALIFAFVTRIRVLSSPVQFRDVVFYSTDALHGSWVRHSDAYVNQDVLFTISEWVNDHLNEKKEFK